MPLGKPERKHYMEQVRQHQEGMERGNTYPFGIFSKDGALLGSVSLMDLSRGVFQNAYLGYRLFSQHWRQGFGKEAVAAVLDIGFKDLGLHRIEAGIMPNNRRSIALAKSLGFRKEGLSRGRLFLRGQWRDMALYVILSEDFGIFWKDRTRT